MAKIKYKSPYINEMIQSDIGEYLIQYKDQEDKLEELARRQLWIAQRIEHDQDLKLTPYNQTRCNNIIEKLYKVKDIEELKHVCTSASNISFSGYFPYREFLDLLAQKMEVLLSENDDSMWFELVKMSLAKNNVIAAKIIALNRV